jgi:hypothetical protein
MRLTKHDEVRAMNELLGILASVHPEWVLTSQLRGTSRFHGSRTLALSQIIQLLRATGRVEERWGEPAVLVSGMANSRPCVRRGLLLGGQDHLGQAESPIIRVQLVS